MANKSTTTKKPLRAGERKLIRRTSRTASEARVDRDSVVSPRQATALINTAVLFSDALAKAEAC